jgi:phospholipid-transporting ATPase
VLTIGDGDNDVSMLKEGDVGVAVRGVEGCQATGVADVVIDEFRLLKRLLLIHGREFHRRLYSLVFILQFKNVWMGLIEFYFGTIHKFTGSPFLEAFSKQLYNLVYTLPPLFHQTFYDY